MNYFNYFTEIEDAFVRRRGKHLLLGPIDWALIEGWQERGVPLHVVLRGVESVFDAFDKNPRPRSIKSLMFCREEVEAQFEEWSATQIGKHDGDKPKASDGLSLDAVREHVARSIASLEKIDDTAINEETARAVARLNELDAALTEDYEAIDKSLSDIATFLDEALLSNTDRGHLKTVEKEIAAQLKAYRDTMEPEAYQQTYRLMLLKRLREDAGVPRLGLFYL